MLAFLKCGDARSDSDPIGFEKFVPRSGHDRNNYTACYRVAIAAQSGLQTQIQLLRTGAQELAAIQWLLVGIRLQTEASAGRVEAAL